MRWLAGPGHLRVKLVLTSLSFAVGVLAAVVLAQVGMSPPVVGVAGLAAASALVFAGAVVLAPLGRGPLESVDRLREATRPLSLEVKLSGAKRVNFLVPMLDIRYVFGGYLGVLNLARRLAEDGLSVRIVSLGRRGPPQPNGVGRLAKFEGLGALSDQVEIVDASGSDEILDVSRDDSFVAVTWDTAHVAHRAAQEAGRQRFLYLIQEYEPVTFPMGSAAALAEQSYRFPHFALFSSELLRDYFRRHGLGVFAQGDGERLSASFENALTTVGAVSARDLARANSFRTLLFYARPEEHAARNMFELGILALEECILDGTFDEHWSLIGIGAQAGARIDLRGGRRLDLRRRTSQPAYRELLRQGDVGLSLMHTPHPSLVPLEMAAAGMVTVTSGFEGKTQERLGAISANLLVAEATVESVSAMLRRATVQSEDLDGRARGAAIAWSRDWNEALNDDVIKRVREFVANQ